MNEIQAIQSKIYEIRGQRVMLDFDLAHAYGIEQPLDIPTQIAMLKGRGLNIVDEQAAEKTLSRISYFL